MSALIAALRVSSEALMYRKTFAVVVVVVRLCCCGFVRKRWPGGNRFSRASFFLSRVSKSCIQDLLFQNPCASHFTLPLTKTGREPSILTAKNTAKFVTMSKNIEVIAAKQQDSESCEARLLIGWLQEFCDADRPIETARNFKLDANRSVLQPPAFCRSANPRLVL